MIPGPIIAEISVESIVMAGAGLLFTALTAIASFFVSRFVSKTEKTSDAFRDLAKDVAVTQRDLKTAFGRIDDLRDQITNLEKRVRELEG
jgi:TolA-binding protein